MLPPAGPPVKPVEGLCITRNTSHKAHRARQDAGAGRYGSGMTSTSAPAVSNIPALCQALAEQPLAQDQAEAIDLIQELERAKAALEAAQARQTAVLEQLRIAEEADRGVSPKRRGKGLGAEIALARRESPTRGSQHLNLARALTTDLPHTLRALEAGRIREEHALAVERETAW